MASRFTTVHIKGAGPTGSLAALALAKPGYRIVLHDRQSIHELLNRSRAYAITHSSRRLLERLNLWDGLETSLIGFDVLDLRDAGCGGQVRFSCGDLVASNGVHGSIGWILDHKPLMQLLLHRLHNRSDIHLFLGSPAPHPGPDDLIVAADGPGSTTRQDWAIPVLRHRYRQGCLTAKVAIRSAETEATAFELFRPEGPLAVLPLGVGTAQVVWSAPLHRCEQRATLDDVSFLDKLAAVLPDGLEPDLLLDRPRAFPQEWFQARRFSRGRGVLLGEAAHRCHPVGGQGLNLCWRDVDVLSRVAKPGLDPRQVVRRYGRRRWVDVLAVGLSTDLLVRVFSNRHPLICMLRKAALMALANVSPIRHFSLKAMTDGPLQLLRSLPH